MKSILTPEDFEFAEDPTGDAVYYDQLVKDRLTLAFTCLGDPSKPFILMPDKTPESDTKIFYISEKIAVMKVCDHIVELYQAVGLPPEIKPARELGYSFCPKCGKDV